MAPSRRCWPRRWSPAEPRPPEEGSEAIPDGSTATGRRAGRGRGAEGVRAWLALGSNVGEREEHLGYALRQLAERAGGLIGVSAVYETDPVGYEDQGPFLNLVAGVETPLAPDALLSLVRTIETERGRERTFRNAPRTLDIDILVYGDRRIDAPALTIPHPRMTERAFVLVPLLELAPDLIEPGTGTPYRAYLERPATGVRRRGAGTDLMRGR